MNRRLNQTPVRCICLVMGQSLLHIVNLDKYQTSTSVCSRLCSYNGSANVMLEAISQKPERYRIIIASHNEESVRRVAERMEELGIDRDGGSVCFGQLLGMCDHVSLTLGEQYLR